MGNRVEGKVVLVAGAGSVAPGWSNGRAASVLYAREGAKVFAADIRLETAQETKDIIDGEGGECTTFQVDVSNAEQVQAMVEKCIKTYGRIDILHNNVAIIDTHRLVEMTEESWDQVMAVNVKSIFLTCKFCIPHMENQGGGAIVNISSAGAVGPGSGPYLTKPATPGISGYGAAKAALERFTQGLAQEVADDGIAVTALAPSLIVPTSGAVFHGGARYLGDENGEPPEVMGQATLLLATEPSAKVNGRVVYSQQILQEFGWITNGVGTGIDSSRPGSGFSMI